MEATEEYVKEIMTGVDRDGDGKLTIEGNLLDLPGVLLIFLAEFIAWQG